MMTTVDHAVEEECRRNLLEEEEEHSRSPFPLEEYNCSVFPSEEEEGRDKFHVFMSAVKNGVSYCLFW